MTDAERKAYVTRLRELRKSPQTLTAAVASESTMLTSLHGESSAAKIRRAIGTVNPNKRAAVAEKAQELASKWSFVPVTPTTPTTPQ